MESQEGREQVLSHDGESYRVCRTHQVDGVRPIRPPHRLSQLARHTTLPACVNPPVGASRGAGEADTAQPRARRAEDEHLPAGRGVAGPNHPARPVPRRLVRRQRLCGTATRLDRRTPPPRRASPAARRRHPHAPPPSGRPPIESSGGRLQGEVSLRPPLVHAHGRPLDRRRRPASKARFQHTALRPRRSQAEGAGREPPGKRGRRARAASAAARGGGAAPARGPAGPAEGEGSPQPQGHQHGPPAPAREASIDLARPRHARKAGQSRVRP